MKLKGIKSYKQTQVEDEYDVIVIGSGMGGMTCAGILAREGEKVLVLERHYTAGGYTHVFKRNGYEWDVGIHYIGGVNHPKAMLATLFHYLTDGKLAWADMGEVYDRLFFGEEQFAFYKGKENFAAHLKAQFTDIADHRAIEAYLELVKEVNQQSQTYFAEKALPPAVAKVAGKQMRKGFLRFAEQTTREVLEELTDNQKLIGVLTAQYGDYGLPPGQSSFAMHAMLVNHYLNGGAFPVGGSSRIAETVAAGLADAGGLILTNAEAAEIVVTNGKATGVKMADGKQIGAKRVISSAGIHNTYRRLLPPAIAQQYKLLDTAQKVTPSWAHVALYLGFQQTAAELGLQKANYWVYPAGNYDHDANIQAYLDNPDGEFPLVYISFPSAKDPDWENRYAGKATVDIITFAPYEWFTKWEGTEWKRRGGEYEAFKERFCQRLLAVLYKYEPQLEGKVDYYELSTPLSTRQFVNYQAGEVYGIAHDPNRFQHSFLRPHTPIKNLYLTGQDIVTAGVGAALISGVLTVSAIRKQNYMTKLYKQVAKKRRASGGNEG